MKNRWLAGICGGILLSWLSQGQAMAFDFKGALDSSLNRMPLASTAVSVASNSDAPEKMGIGAENFIHGMGQRALDFLGNASLSQEQKEAKFRTLLNESFDLNTIGRFALGRYWRVSTPEQRNEYLKLFREMVVKVYVERFKEYKGQKFETRSYRMDDGNDALVTSYIVPLDGTQPVQVDWRVRYKEGRYKIVDVLVAGVSMSVTQRSDFSSVIQRGGGDVQVLLAHLREQ